MEIGQPVLEKKIFEGFYHNWAWWPSCPCDQHHFNIFSFPCTQKLSYEIWLKNGNVVSEKSVVNLGTLPVLMLVLAVTGSYP